MKNKKKEMLLIGLGIVSILVVIIGVTYAFFNYTKQGSTNNVIETGTIKFLYDEKYGYGNGIQIIDAVPMSDTMGKAQKGNNQVFDFRIVSTTMSNTAIPYTITVKKYDSDLDDKFIKLYLTKVEGENEEELVLSKFNGEIGENYLDSYKGSTVEKILYEGRVPSNRTDYEINYRLRMWIDESIDFSPEKDGNGNSVSGESPYNGQSFKIKVNVYANGQSLDEEGLANESKAEIKSFSLGGEEIDPSDTDSKLYEAILPEGTTSTTVDIETESEYASVKIEKTDSNYNSLTSMNTGIIEKMSTQKTLSLTPGENYFKIIVIAENGTPNPDIYKLHITVEKIQPLTDAIFETNPKPSGASDYIELDNDINSENFAFNGTSQAKGHKGLYKSTYIDENNQVQTSYYYRGAVENNYVYFADKLWRIVRINEDGSIRLILQDNIGAGYAYPNISASAMYYSNWINNVNGYAKYELNKWYNNNINIDIPNHNKKYTNYLSESIDGGYFCEQPTVAYRSDFTSALTGVNMILYSDYTPNYECKNVGTSPYIYGKVAGNIGLITYDEVVMAGGYYDTTSNYYLKSGVQFWTMSPAGAWNGSQPDIWYIESDGKIKTVSPSGSLYVRPVINLDKTVTVKGSGSETSPFTVVYTP